MPVLYPANVQEYLDFGLHGWAMSRYSGCWVAFKALADTVETSASVNIDPSAVNIVYPTDFTLPPDGLNIRWPDPPLVQEKRLLHHKLYAALAYCRANGLNRVVIDSPQPRLGIITAGKSYLDVRQALDDLGIDEALAAEIGIRLYKVGMVWPLEAEGVRRFAEGLDEILVIEEKRQLIEYQLKEELYNWREDVRPRVVGKFDEKGEWALIHSTGADGRIIIIHNVGAQDAILTNQDANSSAANRFLFGIGSCNYSAFFICTKLGYLDIPFFGHARYFLSLRFSDFNSS